MIYIYYALPIILIIGVIIWLKFKRNYFNKYQYIRLVTYHEDMTISVKYIKKDQFNLDHSILINPKHIYNFKGYTTVVKTSHAQESINPIDFEAKFSAQEYKTAIKSKLISDTFATLKVDKIDKMMILIFLNIITLVAVAYLIYTLMGNSTS